MAAALTLGVEEELHLVDQTTSLLAPGATQLLAALPSGSFGAELQRTTVETNTGVWKSLYELRDDIVVLRPKLIDAAANDGLMVGTPPLSSAKDFELTASGRFSRMQQEYRLLVNVLYRRLDVELTDLRDEAGRHRRGRSLQAAANGGAALANAQGNGLADDKAMACRPAGLRPCERETTGGS